MREPTATERENIVNALFNATISGQDKRDRFGAYFAHYYGVLCPASTGAAVIDLETPALGSHADVLRCINILTQQPTISFNEFIRHAFRTEAATVTLREKKYVARVVTEVAFLIGWNFKDHYPIHSINSLAPDLKWDDSDSFCYFIENSFNLQSREFLDQQSSSLGSMNKSALKAWKLVNRNRIKIRPTNNLSEHLSLNPGTKTLKVFHQISFLRAHLVKSKHLPLDLTFTESIMRGTLPPRLLLETLLTFHDVLFPIAFIRDRRSRSTLETMIQKHGFDAEAGWIEFVRPIPHDINFDYWGGRLKALHDVVRKPPPDNAIMAWFERHTSERNALTVAIVGLFLSVLFGMLSFVVGLLQLVLAWIAYNNRSSS